MIQAKSLCVERSGGHFLFVVNVIYLSGSKRSQGNQAGRLMNLLAAIPLADQIKSF